MSDRPPHLDRKAHTHAGASGVGHTVDPGHAFYLLQCKYREREYTLACG